MNSPAEDIKDLLVADVSLGLTFGTNLFISREPEKPDNCTTIFDTPGLQPQLTFNREEMYEYPSIQIRVRNNSYTACYTLIKQIFDSIHGQAITINGTLYTVIRATDSPALLDFDDNKRTRFFINFNLQRR